MKRRFTILLAALLLSCGLGWAQTRTEVTDVLNLAFTGVTGTTYTEWSGKTSNSDAVYAGLSAGGNDAIQLRVKNNNEGIVTTASGGMVTKVAVVWNSNTLANRQISVWGKNTAYSSAANLFNTSEQGTYLGTLTYGTDQSTELTISDEYTFLGIRSVSGALYLDEIDITWEDGAATTDPTITVSPMTINAPAGGLDGNFTVTCANVDDPYVLDVTYFTSDGTALNPDASPDWISYSNLDTENATSIGYYIDANTGAARTAYLKIQCMVNGAPIVESGVITINQATILSNIAALTALTDAGNYEVTLTDAVVTYVNGNYAYIQDASGAVLYYKNGHGLTAGDVLNGTATVDYQVRNSNPQITDLTGVTPVSGTAPEPTEVAASAWNYTFGNVLSRYFKVTGAIITQSSNKYYVSLGGENIQLYKAAGSISDLDLNKTYSITGFPTMYNTTKELQIFDNPEVEVTTEPSITVTPMTVNAPAGGLDGNFTVTCANVDDPYVLDVTYFTSDGTALNPDASPDWISYGNLDTENATSIGYFIDANTGAARTAYLKIQCFVGGASIAESGLIIVTQAAYEAPHVTWDLSIASYASASEQQVTWTSDYATMVVDKANASTNANNYLGGNQTSTRFYKNSNLTLSPAAGYAITNVVFTATSTSYANALVNSTWTNATASADGTTVTVIPTDGATAMVAAIGGTCGFTSVTVYYEENTAPAVPSITITPDSFELDANSHMAEVLAPITYQNIVVVSGSGTESFDVQYYDAEGQEIEQTWCTVGAVANGDTDFNLSIAAGVNEGNEARTAYFKLYGLDEEANVVYSNLVTVTQAAPVIDYATLPFVWEGGPKADFLALNGVTAQGLGSDYASGNAPYLIKFDNTGDYIQVKCDQQPGKVTIGVKMIGGGDTSTITIQGSADGETFTDIQELTISGAQGDELTLETTTGFAAEDRYVRMLFTKGSNVGVGPISIAVPSTVPSITFNPDVVDLDAEQQTIQIPFTYENIVVTGYQSFTVHYYDANDEEIQLPETPWYVLGVTGSNDEGYNLTGLVTANEGEARSAYMKVSALDAEENVVYSNLITINQEGVEVPPTGDEYALYTGELVEGDYLIVYDGGAMNTTVTSDRLQYEDVTVTNGVIVTDNAAIVWHIARSGEYWTIYNADAVAYAASTGVKNKAQMLVDGTDDKALWTVSGTETYEFVNKFNTVNSVNANLRKNGTYGFACYASSTGGALSLYKKVAEPATETHDLTINGYTSDDDGWYLIASPVSTTPSEVTNMLNDTYDLYRFNQAAAPDSDGITKEWENYRIHQGDFNIVPGQGYLYANSNTVELSFTGTPYSGNGTITLANAGWNLVGNPFGFEAIITDKDCYTINDEHTGIMPEISTRNIAVMEGVFVQASAAGETVTFSRPAKSNDNRSAVVMNLSQGRGTIDRAIVRFGNNNTLPKFQLFENSTKLYIAQNGEDFAIVNADNQGEMPVSFKANKNGQYTITVNAEGVEMNYLHLIDNMTGADVDLLQTPSYSFEAKTTDYESRFRLVFSNESASGANFAYFNGSEWVVNGNGTLQVIDVMGRILSSQNVDGSVNVNAAPGVYMIRLINGDNVKTQKVVVR